MYPMDRHRGNERYGQWNLRRRRYIPKPGVRGNAAYPGNAERGDMVTPTGLDNRPTFMAVFVLRARLVRGIPRL